MRLGATHIFKTLSFFFNSSMIGYISIETIFGNVIVLTQAKMYLQYSEFLQKKCGDFTRLLYMQKSRTRAEFHKHSKNVKVGGSYYKVK